MTVSKDNARLTYDDSLLTLAKKRKWRNRWVTILGSSLVTLALLLAGIKVIDQITTKHGRETADYYTTMSQIAYPNIGYTSAYINPTSFFGGEFISDRVKDINGIRTTFECYKATYGIWGANHDAYMSTSSDDQAMVYTRPSNYKVPLFYNTKIDYTRPSDVFISKNLDELTYVRDMKGQAVEVALTFDKPYTIEEIQEMMPDNLKYEWYWIGTESDLDTSQLSPSDQLGFSFSEGSDLSYQQFEALRTMPNNEAYMKAYNKMVKENGEMTFEKGLDNAFTYFQANAQEALDKGWLNAVHRTAAQDIKAFLKKYDKGSQAKFSGILVTGRAENFAQLEDKDWIYASSIGQSVFIQPYHKLDK